MGIAPIKVLHNNNNNNNFTDLVNIDLLGEMSRESCRQSDSARGGVVGCIMVKVTCC